MQIQRQRHELSAPLEQPPCQQTVIGVPYRELVSPTVLVVDDEKKLRTLVREYLEREGYAVLEAADGQTALDLARTAGPDLVLLDLGLPRLPGDEVARLLRKDSDLPIVMLTAKASENDRVAGLRLGADDYVVKPFSPRELVARVEAVLRRSRPSATESSTDISYGDGRLRIDTDRREVRAGDALVELTRSEFDLLAALASRPGRAWTRLELVGRIQGHAFDAYERTIDVHVKNLRRKLSDTAPFQVVATVPGIGYKFALDRDA
ncbi:response regulator transcription factor [Mycobacterium avium subsp. hominissuis]|uniref:DNA-binding response regulator n=2 Tax=Mycobacterium avium complex (MAC) TaxID=120793 RepID=A0AAI8SNK4_MYCAV|nr:MULTISPECIES: response regulator transcription factor [Mycobacterium]BBN48519.1 DNA-binding response regulator [Mycobacterium avium subsp. hominissuis]ASL15677.1 putative sensory transduction protein [Mycobacterium intracellulare subsp. chimaera]ASL21797.1 putative sensory transduction protein [Mycobacterium intracellulare subsp. chimaera]WRU80320.1 response regulator transcription factor [Mycobacterium sp. 5-140-3-2]WSE43527.1 response regulator transcription factor [Mycobacterium sp. 5-14